MDMMVLKLKNKSFLSNVNKNINILCKFVLKQLYFWSPSVSRNDGLSGGRPSGQTPWQTPTYTQ